MSEGYILLWASDFVCLYISLTVDSMIKTVGTFFVDNFTSLKKASVHFSPRSDREWDIVKIRLPLCIYVWGLHRLMRLWLSSLYIFLTVDSTLKTVETFFVENFTSFKSVPMHFSPNSDRKRDIVKIRLPLFNDWGLEGLRSLWFFIAEYKSLYYITWMSWESLEFSEEWSRGNYTADVIVLWLI